MFTQPNAEQKVVDFDEQGNPVESWIPIRPSLWSYFSTKEQAESIQAKVTSVCPNASLIDGLNVDLFIPVRYLDDTTKIWVYKGTITGADGNVRGLDEYAGSLWDRQTQPNPFIDGVGGPNLIVKDITTDLVELKWGA